MITMILQILGTLLTLAAGILALRIAHCERRGTSPHRPVWLVAGSVWVAHGAIQGLQNLWGSAAMAAGGESRVMAGYLRWAPAFNHSRTFLWLTVCAVLVWLTFAPRPGRRGWLAIGGALALGTVAGAAFGAAEGTLRPLTHYNNVAVLDAVELVLFLTTLFVTLLKDRVDRYLWAGLLVWALTVAINILWYAALSLVDDPRAWSPSPASMGVYRALLLGALLAVLGRRYGLARRGVAVKGIIPDRASGVSTFAR